MNKSQLSFVYRFPDEITKKLLAEKANALDLSINQYITFLIRRDLSEPLPEGIRQSDAYFTKIQSEAMRKAVNFNQ